MQHQEGIRHWVCGQHQHPGGQQEHREQLQSTGVGTPQLYNIGTLLWDCFHPTQIQAHAPDLISEAVQHSGRSQPGEYQQEATAICLDSQGFPGLKALLEPPCQVHCREGSATEPHSHHNCRVHLGSHLHQGIANLQCSSAPSHHLQSDDLGTYRESSLAGKLFLDWQHTGISTTELPLDSHWWLQGDQPATAGS